MTVISYGDCGSPGIGGKVNIRLVVPRLTDPITLGTYLFIKHTGLRNGFVRLAAIIPHGDSAVRKSRLPNKGVSRPPLSERTHQYIFLPCDLNRNSVPNAVRRKKPLSPNIPHMFDNSQQRYQSKANLKTMYIVLKLRLKTCPTILNIDSSKC